MNSKKDKTTQQLENKLEELKTRLVESGTIESCENILIKVKRISNLIYRSFDEKYKVGEQGFRFSPSSREGYEICEYSDRNICIHGILLNPKSEKINDLEIHLGDSITGETVLELWEQEDRSKSEYIPETNILKPTIKSRIIMHYNPGVWEEHIKKVLKQDFEKIVRNYSKERRERKLTEAVKREYPI